MNLIIPMAGRGTRMRPSTLTIPKPLFPIADKSIVEWLVYEVFHSTNVPIEEIGFIIHPDFGKKVENELIDIANKYNAIGKIYYQEQALGTAHAILCAEPSLKGNVLIAFADTLFQASFNIDTNKDAIIWTKTVDNPKQYGIVVTDEQKKILYFEEKPENPVSNEAIIGIYFFKDGENLKSELKYLIDNDLKEKGEYQLTNAMENMRNKGLGLYSQDVDKWLDCGNKDTTLYSHRVVLETHHIHSKSFQNINSKIIPPCYIGENVKIENSIIGPFVSIGNNTQIKDSQIEDSIVMQNSELKNIRIHKSIIGNYCKLNGHSHNVLAQLHISDYSQIEIN
ncbi:MAG: sugar phosphate nucleotidyltransferase [Bacteroidota bacterium]